MPHEARAVIAASRAAPVSIRSKLLSLPEATIVHPGHGEDTTIDAEAPSLQEWIERGH